MRPPPLIHPTHNPNPTAVRTAREKRDLLVQCDRCSVKGTARTSSRRDHFATIDLPATRRGADWFHAGCGGRLQAFDLKGSDG